MKLALDSLYPSDTFNLITFAGDTNILFPEPVPATKQNLQKAQAFLASRSGSGGTEMMKAIRAALEPSDKQDHMRIVCFMTDGYVGNDMEIISEIQKHANARVFAFGIGGSVNRFLLDKMAENGRGEVEYVALNDDGSAAARRFHERIRNPLLTDISIDWGGLPVADVYPQRIPDLFSAKPLVLNGRFIAPANGTIRLKGKIAGNDFVREIPVNLPEAMAANDVLSSLWARQRIENLMSQDYQGAQNGSMRPDLKATVTQLGLEYRLMTQFTSFVAVEEMIVTDGGAPRKVDVPIEVPEGVNRDFVDPQEMTALTASGGNYMMAGRGFGSGAGGSLKRYKTAQAPPAATPVATSSPSGVAPQVDARRLAMEVDAANKVVASSKTHPAIAGLIERVRNKQLTFNPTEASFVKNGKAEIQVWLNDKSAANLDQLKQLGFEVVLDPKSSKLLIGRISVEKLEALSKLEFVRYISPQSLK
jgi:Ca-activated chloride channel family protein